MPEGREMILPDRMYLLSYHLDKEKLADKSETKKVVRAGTLTQLLLDGYLADQDGTAVTTGSREPAEPVLARAYREIAAAEPKQWKSWFRHGDDEDFAAVQDELTRGGVIQVESGKVLGLVPHDQVKVIRRDAVEQLVASVRDTLTGDTPPGDVDRYAAATLVLATTADLHHVIPKKLEKQYSARLDALKADFARIAGSLERALTGILLTRAAAITGGK